MKKINEIAYSVPRNPHLGKIERNEILLSGVKIFPSLKKNEAPKPWAFRMYARRINENEFGKAGFLGPRGYLNCFNEGLVFLPDSLKEIARVMGQLVAHLAIGAVMEGQYSMLGKPLSTLAGEAASTKFMDSIIDEKISRNRVFREALQSKDFFFIPYAEMTGFIKRTYKRFLEADLYQYIFTRATADENKVHYVMGESARWTWKGGSFSMEVLVTERLHNEISRLGYSTIMEKIDSSFINKWDEEYQKAEPARQKMIAAEYAKEIEKKVLDLGYSLKVLNDSDYFNDKKLAAEILEKLSPVLESYNKIPHHSALIQKLREAVK